MTNAKVDGNGWIGIVLFIGVIALIVINNLPKRLGEVDGEHETAR